MSKHMNGPWKVRTSPRGSKALTIFQTKADDLPIATVHIGAGNTASQAANANLIAEAPTMFETLELIEQTLSDHPDVAIGNSKVHFVYHAARTARKRAERE